MKEILTKLMLTGLFSVMTLQVYAQNLITTDDGWTAINLTVTDELVIPAYQRMESQSLELIEAMDSFCEDINEQNLTLLKSSYTESMSSWQAIQHIQFGPITYFNWNYRMQYWPDERGTGGRQLDALITAGEIEILASENFARQSVGIQGLPALERLLYNEDALSEFQNNDYLCQLSRTIARNINEISAGVRQRWTDEYRDVVADPVADGFYEDAEDLSIDFLKALQEAIAKIRDLKLAPVLGESFARARIREAESWRSEQSLANIKINLPNLEQLFAAYVTAFHDEDVAAVLLAFNDLNVQLSSLPDALAIALSDEAQYEQILDLHTGVEALHEALETALKNTDLYLGFNSLDGD